MTSKQGMTKEQAHELYDSMKKAMEAKYGKKGLARMIAAEKKQGGKTAAPAAAARGKNAPAPESAADLAGQMRGAASRIGRRGMRSGAHGQRAALALVMVCGLAKLTFSALEAAGIMTAQPADAAMISPAQIQARPRYSEEELTILKSLDERRVGLEERTKKVEEREEELERRDREFASRLTQLRELSDKLKLDREKGEKKRSAQLDQLAAVYGSMNPKEASELLEQLDVTIALSLIERMPEKRIGQILSMMSPERALSLTQMLSRK